MTSLLGSLVERSVRAPPVAAADRRSPSRDAATSRERDGEPARDAPPGAIVPRRRSRFEPQGAEAVLGEMEERVDASSAPPSAAPPRRRQAPADVRSAPAGSLRVPRPASDEVPPRAPLEAAPRPIPAAAPPVATRAAALPVPPVSQPLAAAADSAAAPTSRADDAAPRREPPAAERARVATVGAVVAAPAALPERSSADEVAPVSPVRPSRAPVARIVARPSVEPPAELAAVRLGEIAPARLRETARRSDPSGPRLPADRPAVPSVQVSIGRVEVRAVFAPPPLPSRRPSPAPTLSLDDYLKQREKGG